MTLEIRVIDPHDETALRAWWEVGKAATAERPGNPWPGWEVSRTALRADNPEQRHHADRGLRRRRDGRRRALPAAAQREPPHLRLRPVRRARRRRREGIGTRLLADVEARAAEHGRTTLQCVGYVPPGETGPAEQFAEARGYAVASREGFKELRLADYRDRRADLVAAVGDAADDYTHRHLRHRLPRRAPRVVRPAPGHADRRDPAGRPRPRGLRVDPGAAACRRAALRRASAATS